MYFGFRRGFAALLAACLLLAGLSGCIIEFAEPEPPGPEDTVIRLVDAINVGDINKALECITPAYSILFGYAVDITANLSGLPIRTLIDEMPTLYYLGDYFLEDALAKVNLEVLDIREGRDRAEVICRLSTTGLGEAPEGMGVFYLEYIDEVWYIYDIGDL